MIQNDPPHIVIGDMNHYLDNMHRDNLAHAKSGQPYQFSEPTTGVLAYYKSCLVVPVKGRLPDLGYDFFKPTNFMKMGEESLLGLICLDSMEKNLFDDGYDRDLMDQLATYTFMCLRECYVAQSELIVEESRADNAKPNRRK